MQITQDERNMGMLVHGLVALVGLSSFVPGLSFLSLVAAVACIVLYFVYKDKSEFVRNHAKQAAGFQITLFLVGLVLGIVLSGVAATAVMTGGFGAALAVGSLTVIVGIILGLLALVFGVMGLTKAQKGDGYRYPVVGPLVDKINI